MPVVAVVVEQLTDLLLLVLVALAVAATVVIFPALQQQAALQIRVAEAVVAVMTLTL